ncbi:hypothetical protein [Alkaliphilus crotonatoxidans]
MKKAYQSPASVSFGGEIEPDGALVAVVVGGIVGGAGWAIGIGPAWIWG